MPCMLKFCTAHCKSPSPPLKHFKLVFLPSLILDHRQANTSHMAGSQPPLFHLQCRVPFLCGDSPPVPQHTGTPSGLDLSPIRCIPATPRCPSPPCASSSRSRHHHVPALAQGCALTGVDDELPDALVRVPDGLGVQAEAGSYVLNV